MYIPSYIAEPTRIFPVFGIRRKECFQVDITGKDYAVCVEASNRYWANEKTKDEYGRGLIRTEDDQYKPVRTGLLGQMAFSKAFHEPIDLEYRKGGDSFDNLIGKLKFDIKCAAKNRGVGLIYHTSKSGVRIPADKDVYVFGYVENECLPASDCEGQARVILVGFCMNADLAKFRVRPGRGGEAHMNYEIPYWQTREIGNLLKCKNLRERAK